MLDLFGFIENRNKRVYSKKKVIDLDEELLIELDKINNDPNKILLNVIHNNSEKIIVYRTILDQDEKSVCFFINLLIISQKGIVLNRIRLSAIYNINGKSIELCDIEVFGENEGRGYGSILLSSLLNFALKSSVIKVFGWISKTDKDHFDKLNKFYNKHGFKVVWSKNTNNGNKVADIIWTNG